MRRLTAPGVCHTAGSLVSALVKRHVEKYMSAHLQGKDGPFARINVSTPIHFVDLRESRVLPAGKLEVGRGAAGDISGAF